MELWVAIVDHPARQRTIQQGWESCVAPITPRPDFPAEVLCSQCFGRRIVLPHTYIWGQRRHRGLDVRRGMDGLATGGEIAVSVFIVSVSRYRNTQTIDHYVNTVLTFAKTTIIVYLYFIDGRIMCWYLIIFHHVSVVERPMIQRTPENIDFLFY